MITLTREEVLRFLKLLDAEIERKKSEQKETASLVALRKKLGREVSLEGPGPYVFYKKWRSRDDTPDHCSNH